MCDVNVSRKCSRKWATQTCAMQLCRVDVRRNCATQLCRANVSRDTFGRHNHVAHAIVSPKSVCRHVVSCKYATQLCDAIVSCKCETQMCDVNMSHVRPTCLSPIQQVEAMLHRLGVRDANLEERLPTTRPREIFARMLRNLVVAHRPPDVMRGAPLDAAVVVEKKSVIIDSYCMC